MGISVGPSALGVATTLLLILIVVLWFVIGTAAALRSEPGQTPNRLAQMYGYTICLIAVVVALGSTTAIIGAAFDRAYPLQSEYPFGASLTSVEAFRATYDREPYQRGPGDTARPDTSADAMLRRYEALVSDRAASTQYRTSKAFLTSGILFLIAAGLFLGHWRWLRRLTNVPGSAG